MIICEHCREAIDSRGEELSVQSLTDDQLSKVRRDEDGLEWLVCDWCKDEDTTDQMMDAAFV